MSIPGYIEGAWSGFQPGGAVYRGSPRLPLVSLISLTLPKPNKTKKLQLQNLECAPRFQTDIKGQQLKMLTTLLRT